MNVQIARRCCLLTCLCLGAFGSHAWAEETEEDPLFPETVAINDVNLVITGAATRSAVFRDLYYVASYCPDHPEVYDAETLLKAKVHKHLRFVICHHLTGALLPTGFKRGLKDNDPDGVYAEEVDTLLTFLKKHELRIGDEIYAYLTPEGVLTCVVGDEKCTINRPGFGEVMWSIYFGKHNVSEQIRSDLTYELVQKKTPRAAE